MLSTAVRAKIVERFKRRSPATTYEVLEVCRELLGREVVRDSSDEIVELWKHQQRTQRQYNDVSLPLSPAASSSTRSHWSPSDVRRSLSVYPKCIGDSEPLSSSFVLPALGTWYHAESKSHNGPGSYITAAILSTAEVGFEETGSIKLQCRPPKDMYGPLMMRDHSQSRSWCYTLFNIVSQEEADYIGMTKFDILYGVDFDHDIDQQHRAERVEPESIPPRAPTPPPNRRAASPTASTISMGSRLEPRPARHESQGASSGYSMSHKNQYGEFSITAPRSESNFMSNVKDILPFISGAPPPSFHPSPMLIHGAADNQYPCNINNRVLESQYSTGHTVHSVTPSDHTGFEHGHKRKATDDVAPTPFRRPHWMDEPSGSGDL